MVQRPQVGIEQGAEKDGDIGVGRLARFIV